MTTDNKKQIGHLYFYLDKPTELTFFELQSWVLWQFPHKSGTTLTGAVHPPLAEYGWLPAYIWPQQKRVIVHAHHDRTYPSPEAAAAAL